jgi:oligoribonuclease NrnB/cAMP/cGMP phosphodiesterase (DHH superfamily)
MKTYVLFHAGCFDGFCSAWVARTVLKGDVEYIPVNYGQPVPVLETHCRLYILDFCYSQAQLLAWWNSTTVDEMVILDHHKTAQQALTGFDKVCEGLDLACPLIKFDMNKSGGRLAWEHFRPGAPIPGLVAYTEDRDLWLWKQPESREVNACLRSHKMDFDLWDSFGFLSTEDLWLKFRLEGSAILRREAQIVGDHVKFAREVTIAGHHVLMVNATVCVSEIGAELASGRPFGATYLDRQDGFRIYSLRSRDGGIDVSQVAKSFGGGGHRNAAGFEVAPERIHEPL